MTLDTIIRKRYQLVAFALVAVAAIAAFWLVGPLNSTAGSQGDTAILEEGGNINLALRQAQKGMGPSIVGDPTAIYGKIMAYSAALEAVGEKPESLGDSQAWKLDRTVYLYLFEDHMVDSDPRTRDVSDWAHKVIILDAETGSPFIEITHRETTKLDVTQFLSLTIRDNTKGVPPREIKSLNRPPPIPVEPATPAPRDVQSR